MYHKGHVILIIIVLVILPEQQVKISATNKISVTALFKIMKQVGIYKREFYINSYNCSHPKI